MLGLDLLKEIKFFSRQIKAKEGLDWCFLANNPAAIHLLKDF